MTAMSAHGAAQVSLLVPPAALGAELLPGMPGPSQPGTRGKRHREKSCGSSLFYSSAEQNQEPSKCLCCFYWAFIGHLFCTFKNHAMQYSKTSTVLPYLLTYAFLEVIVESLYSNHFCLILLCLPPHSSPPPSEKLSNLMFRSLNVKSTY